MQIKVSAKITLFLITLQTTWSIKPQRVYPTSRTEELNLSNLFTNSLSTLWLTFSTSAFVTLMSASIFSKYCCARSASLQSRSNRLLLWKGKKAFIMGKKHNTKIYPKSIPAPKLYVSLACSSACLILPTSLAFHVFSCWHFFCSCKQDHFLPTLNSLIFIMHKGVHKIHTFTSQTFGFWCPLSLSLPPLTVSLFIHHMNGNSNVLTFEKQHLTQKMVSFHLLTEYEAIQLTDEQHPQGLHISSNA